MLVGVSIAPEIAQDWQPNQGSARMSVTPRPANRTRLALTVALLCLVPATLQAQDRRASPSPQRLGPAGRPPPPSR